MMLIILVPRKPLFPGQYEVDQLGKIFEVGFSFPSIGCSCWGVTGWPICFALSISKNSKPGNRDSCGGRLAGGIISIAKQLLLCTGARSPWHSGWARPPGWLSCDHTWFDKCQISWDENNVSKSKIKLTSPILYPPQATDLLSKMLTFHPSSRITAAEALAHPYFADFGVSPHDLSSSSSSGNTTMSTMSDSSLNLSSSGASNSSAMDKSI